METAASFEARFAPSSHPTKLSWRTVDGTCSGKEQSGPLPSVAIAVAYESGIGTSRHSAAMRNLAGIGA
jgi:hypothetical protein